MGLRGILVMQSGNPEDEDRFSVIEDLDPEEGRGRRGLARLDLLVGVPLVLLVILFVGWNWWHTEQQAAQYRAGEEAARNNDIDAALGYFAGASGYKDADIQAQNFRVMLENRDRLYKSAVDFADQGNWLEALRDIREVAKIQPEYEDVAARESNALDHAYTEALSGTVVQREKANPPGLYMRGEAGWTWLEGSDARSSVQLMSADGKILYDVPGENGSKPTPTPTGEPDYGVRSLFDEKREIEVAIPKAKGEGEGYTFRNLGLFLKEPWIMGQDGFWMAEGGDEDNDIQVNMVMEPLAFTTVLAYHPFFDGVSVLASIRHTESYTTGNVLVDVDLSSNRYLMAQWTDGGARGPKESTVLDLKLYPLGDGDVQQVYTIRGGGLESAMMSPDGRYVLLETYSIEGEGDAQVYEKTTLLVDLKNGNETRTLAHTTTMDNPRFQPERGVSAAFVERGAFKRKLLMVDYIPSNSDVSSATALAKIQLFDLDKVMGGGDGDVGGVSSEITATVSGIEASSWSVVAQNEDGLIIEAQGPYSSSANSPNPTTLIVIDAEGNAQTYAADGGSSTSIRSVRATEEAIVWSSLGFDYGYVLGHVGQAVYSVGRLPEGEPGKRSMEPKLIYEARDADAGLVMGRPIDQKRLFGKVNLGDGLIGYTVNGDLHLHSYDEDVDLVVEQGVTAIWPNDQPVNLR